MMGKKQDLKCHNCGKTGHNQNTCWACKVCGKSGHATEHCWWLKGTPGKGKKINQDHRGNQDNRGKGKGPSFRPPQNKETSKAPGSWSEGKEKVAANVCTQAEKGGWTTEQLEQLLRMLPLPSKSGHDDTEVTHVGEVELKNGLKLKNVIYAPHFQHNLISVQKLSQQEDCEVIFTQEHCMIKDRSSPYVLGVGRMVKGVYHLVNMKVEKLAEKLKHHVQQYQHLCNDDTGKNLMREDTSQNHIDSDLTSESLQSGVHDEQPDEEEVESQPEIVSYERKSSREHKAPSWHKDYLVGSVQAAPNPQVSGIVPHYLKKRMRLYYVREKERKSLKEKL
ncbi:Gag-Pol polyprotein [Bienertia sinuspersici]